MGKQKLLVIDTETGGLDPAKHSILTFGGVVWEDGALTGHFEIEIVEPEIVTDPRALEVNRIDVEKLKKTGVPPAEAATQFEDFLEKNFEPREYITLAGHNIDFDIRFLERLYRFAGRDRPRQLSHRTVDTATIVRFLIMAGTVKLQSASSDAAFEYFNIIVPEDKRHSALADATATAHLISRMLNLLKSMPNPVDS